MQSGDSRLPSINDLYEMSAVDRQILEARIAARIKRIRRENIQKATALPDIADWIENNFYNPRYARPNQTDFSNVPKIKLTSVQKRSLRKCFTLDPLTGKFPYRTVVISKPKKSGKSTEGAAIGAYFAANVEAPNSVYVLANDREQSSGRVFAFMKPTLAALGAHRFETPYKRLLPNGTVIVAATSDPEREAGGSYMLTIWDELWAYKSERARLLWDELMPILTLNISMRLIVTYAGFEDSSDLLFSLYSQVFTDTTETQLQEGARPVAELIDITTTNSKGESIPVFYEVPKIGLFYCNDHEQRMPWQQGEAAEELRAETEALGMLQTNVFRLMENRWQKTESRLLDATVLAASFDRKNIQVGRKMTFAIDASSRHDCTALAGSYVDDNRYVTAFAKAWYPILEPNQEMDLEETVMAEILKLWRQGLIHRRTDNQLLAREKRWIKTEKLIPIDVHYDPTQFHQVYVNLRKKHRLLIVEFSQKRDRLLADTFLLQQYQLGNVDNIENKDLQSHLDAARAESQTDANNPTLIRIVKGSGKNAKPNDLAVAQSMSIFRASQRPRFMAISSIAQGKAKGWTK